MSIEQTMTAVVPGAGPKTQLMQHKPSVKTSGLCFLIDVAAFYALLCFGQAVLDFDELNSSMELQIEHYSVAYLWLNISVAMTLAAGCVMENINLRPARLFVRL
jgi:hypothetical protein